jgi:hypothetical protein
MKWVLRDTRGLYFREHGTIGPRCTPRVEEAAVFATKRAALLDSAYAFALMSFEPKKVRK